jgi:hypothetical protein
MELQGRNTRKMIRLISDRRRIRYALIKVDYTAMAARMR